MTRAPFVELSVAAAAIAVLVVHIVARAATLTELDSTNLALALDDFDVSKQQPHPPGYPLLVGAAHGLEWLGRPQGAYLALALVFSVGAVCATASLAGELFGRGAAFPAAALLTATPIFLYYDAVVSVYPAEAFFAPLVALFAVRVLRHRDRWSVEAMCVTLAAGSGFRPSMLVLLMPLCFFAIVVGRPRLDRLARGAIVGFAIVVAWAVPTIVESGGLHAYLEASRLYERAAKTTTFALGGDGVANGELAAIATVLAALPSALFLLLARRRRPTGRKLEFALLAVWTLPYLFLIGFIHLGKPGYVIGFLPAICVAAAGLVAQSRRATRTAAVVATAGLAYFLFAPLVSLPSRIEAYRPLAFAPPADAIRVQDRETEALPTIIRTCRPPTCTIVSTGTSHKLWEHDPWSMSRWYVPWDVLRLGDLRAGARVVGEVVWAGGTTPDAVRRHATPTAVVGTWSIYRSNGANTRMIASELAGNNR